jgi:hypothetical protein
MIFPVKVPYLITPDISKYQGETFNKNPGSRYLHQKSIELDRFGEQVLSHLPSFNESIKYISQYLGKEAIDLKELALQLEEDIAILKHGILEAICFCFPSGFIPSEKIGMNFFDMHFPVADGERLRLASDKVTALISTEGNTFRRYVWTVTALSGLSQHPALTRPVPISIDDLYFRTETQTAIGLADDVCLFLVKVEMHPLQRIWDDGEKRKQLLESINSMSTETLTYKNLQQIKQLLNS